MSTAAKRRRLAVHAKCGGRCAYCGELIAIGQMQIDHVHPKVSGGTDEDSNLMPACRQCNNYKHFFTLDQFRQMVRSQVELLRRHSMNFRTAERFGMVVPTNREISFYFERHP